MILNILRFLIGYVKVEIFGFAPERFMNLIINNDIIIWNVETTGNGYIFYTGRYNLIKMKPFLQKTNMKSKIIEKCGLPYVIRRNKKRVAFLFGFCIFLVVTYIMSLFIWEVRIVGEDRLVANTLLEHIEENYAPLGTRKSKIDCTSLEEMLRKDFPDVSWLSCELKGTGLTVYLEEGIHIDSPKNETTDGDIVAAKDATITKMITREGTPIAKVNDTVKKGDILISGTIYIYDDNNEILETNYIAADGDIYGQTTYEYEDYIDLKYYEKQYSTDEKEYITFFFMKYCFTPYIPKTPEGEYDTYTEIHKAKILNDFYLPFGYKTTKWSSYSLKSKTYSEKEAKTILEKRLKTKIASFQEKGVEIIKNDVKIVQSGEKLVAKGTLTLKESIASFKANTNTIQKNEEVK